jgi:acyl-CoA synthetase (AMP-forming)/AMP-acid ligase II
LIFERFKQKALKYPEKIALVFNNKRITYYELLQNVKNRSVNFNMEKFAHVGVFLENSVDFVELLLVASKNGFTLIPFSAKNIDYEKFDIEYIYDGELKKLKPYTKKRSGYIIVSTSGSTSEPKPIVLTEEIKLKRIKIAKRSYNLTQNDTILVSTPLHHSLAQRGVLLSLMIGAKCILLDRFSIEKFLGAVEKERVSFSFAVSNQLEAIKEKVNRYDVSSIKSMVSTSYQMSGNTKKELLKYFDIYECYGTSEIGCVTHLSPNDIDKHKNSVGKVLDGVEIKIKEGEILVKSPWRFKEYYKLSKITDKSFDGEFFKTGDLGEIRDGFLYYKGRKKELIKTGGISVYPVDIEKVIKEVKGVEEVAVIGVEDEYFGEIVVAIVVGDVKKSDIIKACNRLAPYQRPMFVDIVDSLPKNSMGKLQKFKLKENYKNLQLGKRLKGIK